MSLNRLEKNTAVSDKFEAEDTGFTAVRILLLKRTTKR
jgi:hypothetical protein